MDNKLGLKKIYVPFFYGIRRVRQKNHPRFTDSLNRGGLHANGDRAVSNDRRNTD
jgi:hypothetical protein